MDQGEIEFFEKIVEESINVITDAKFVGESFSKGSRPLTIFFEDDLVTVADMRMNQPKLTVEVPSLFPYMYNKMVPWKYNYNYVNEPATANILGIGGMIRSGRCYTPVFAETMPLNLEKEFFKQKELEVTSDVINEMIIEKKASKFLKFIQQREYNIWSSSTNSQLVSFC